MAFTLHLCSWFLSRETWFIELKFFLLNLVQRRERTLNRNLVACTSLVSGFCKVTENVSVVKKSSTFVFNCAVRLRNNYSKLTCWHQTGKSNFFFSPSQRVDWIYKPLLSAGRQSTVLPRVYLKTAKFCHPYFP